MFFRFAHFYQYFIQNFSKIAMPLISMLKITRSADTLALKLIEDDVDEIVSGGLESNLPKSKKIKIIKNLAKSKNPIVRTT